MRSIIKPLLTPPILRRCGQLKALTVLMIEDFRREIVGRVVTLRPRSISMMVNDICNSRCQMCLIWKQSRDHEITPEELRSVLADPLFSKVTNIGVTGGEPTLRKDLAEIFRVIVGRRPQIRHASMITNAIRGKEVEAQVLACAGICSGAGVGFSVMVSLDGLDEVHDTVRGRPGNFSSAIACLERFKSAGISASFGCTITKSNAAHVDDLLDWAQQTGIYGRFRVAEFIDRLYNAPQAHFIRNFTPLERHHLGLFFFRAENEFETDPAIQKTYRSIRGMLAEGKPRSTGCPYHSDAVILTSRGELLYCSPKSPNLGSVLEKGAASKVYFGNLGKRREIREKHCDDCIHDYHAPVRFMEKLRFYQKCRTRAKQFDCRRLVATAQRLPAADPIPQSGAASLKSAHVLIVGWYGTETAGDKAILSTLVRRLQTRANPPSQITLATLFPFITRHTIAELELEGVQLVETFEPEFMQAAALCDEVVVGGGPLMDLEILSHILYAAIRARERRKPVRVEGCGIGPLGDPRFVAVVAEILRLSNVIELRDQPSALRCQHEFNRAAEVIEDPAVDFVRSWAQRTISQAAPGPAGRDTPSQVACFFRELGCDYSGGLRLPQFQARKRDFESGLQDLLQTILRHGLRLGLYPMHSFSVGGDDRKFNRRLARQLSASGFPEAALTVPRLPVSPQQILQAMQNSDFVVCMRFHSVVFAQTLGLPFIAIDYTGGGKIRAFLEGCGGLDKLVTIDQVIERAAGAIFERLFQARENCHR